MIDDRFKRVIALSLVIVGLLFLGLAYWFQQSTQIEEVTIGIAGIILMVVGCFCLVAGVIVYYVDIDMS